MKVKEIKNIIKTNPNYDDYKNNIKNRNFRFILTKIFLIFGEEDINKISSLEFFISNNLNEYSFTQAFEKIRYKADWKNFGKFMFYIFKTSNYKYDMKNKKENIFIDDPIKSNFNKREFYNNWLDSLDFSQEETNEKVKQVLKLVF